MPRILIADDNSNIQRMAALALKDAGIEVIAVGNGEAAVRKMPEILPDLVLADIFMPVRNGYEVCEFVKRDPRYANIPVLLLAGAFDPFDEQEAQRVHADGVLKKPFVPPDPLINAVKTLLAKSAGERLMAVTVPVAAEAAAESGKPTSVAARALAPAVEEVPDLAPEEFALPLSMVDLGAHEKHEKAVALAPLLEAPAAETEEAEPMVTASRDPILGEPAFWVPTEEPAGAGESEEAPSQNFTDHTWNSDSRAVVPLREEAPLLQDLELTAGAQHDDRALSEPISQNLLQDWMAPAPPASAQELAPERSAASSKDCSAEDTLPLPETWAEPAALETVRLEDPSPSESATPPLSAALAPPLTSLLPTEVPPIPAVPSVSAESQSEQTPSEDLEIPTLELDDSLTAWNKPLHSLREPEPATPSQERVTPSQELEAAPQEHATEPEPEFAIEWPPAFVPAISSSVNETRSSALQIVPPVHAAPAMTEPEVTPGPAHFAFPKPEDASFSPEAVEAIVQRVIKRMQPEILEIVTREILRPLVEALVQQELKR